MSSRLHNQDCGACTHHKQTIRELEAEIEQLRGTNCNDCGQCLKCMYVKGARDMRAEVASLFNGSDGIPSLAKLPLYEKFILGLPLKKSS